MFMIDILYEISMYRLYRYSLHFGYSVTFLSKCELPTISCKKVEFYYLAPLGSVYRENSNRILRKFSRDQTYLWGILLPLYSQKRKLCINIHTYKYHTKIYIFSRCKRKSTQNIKDSLQILLKILWHDLLIFLDL